MAVARLAKDVYDRLDKIDNEIALTPTGPLSSLDQGIANFDNFVVRNSARGPSQLPEPQHLPERLPHPAVKPIARPIPG